VKGTQRKTGSGDGVPILCRQPGKAGLGRPRVLPCELTHRLRPSACTRAFKHAPARHQQTLRLTWYYSAIALVEQVFSRPPGPPIGHRGKYTTVCSCRNSRPAWRGLTTGNISTNKVNAISRSHLERWLPGPRQATGSGREFSAAYAPALCIILHQTNLTFAAIGGILMKSVGSRTAQMDTDAGAFMTIRRQLVAGRRANGRPAVRIHSRFETTPPLHTGSHETDNETPGLHLLGFPTAIGGRSRSTWLLDYRTLQSREPAPLMLRVDYPPILAGCAFGKALLRVTPLL